MNKIELIKIKENVLPSLLERCRNDEKYIVEGENIKLAGDFYKNQVRIALKNYDIIDPLNIEEYIATGGYFSLLKCLTELSPEEILNTVIDSKLRGRGGAGFPTGKKWQGAAETTSDKKYIVCNGDEGDPGAYMDRSILEGDPHSVIEGMIIAGVAVGADEGIVYVRAEYPKAVKNLNYAIKEAEKYNLSGDHILGTNFNFRLKVRLGAGAFVCGEGTAMQRSIEGERGMPRSKVYRTNVKGLFDKPTVLNNVETLANVPQIIEHGSDWFKSFGTEDSPGTKVFSLVGKIKNAGLVEVPMGMTINKIIYDIGGGTPDGKKIKAIQTGGPSGGCIPTKLFDTPVDFISLSKIGSIMGSGGMVVIDETDCMVDIAKFFMNFTVDESCGKCTPCRIGNKRVLEYLEKISDGKAEMKDLENLKDLCDVITETSLCGLGKTATTPVVSSIKYFEDEYIEHIQDKKCSTGVCKKLLTYTIGDNCIGCGLCMRNCPADAISGEKRQRHIIDKEVCIKCGTCMDICPSGAISRV